MLYQFHIPQPCMNSNYLKSVDEKEYISEKNRKPTVCPPNKKKRSPQTLPALWSPLKSGVVNFELTSALITNYMK